MSKVAFYVLNHLLLKKDTSAKAEMSNWSKNLGNSHSHSHLNLKRIAIRNSHSGVNFQNSIPIRIPIPIHESIQFSIQFLIFLQKWKKKNIFWKSNQFRFLIIADLAKKYLGVQATSVVPERMFCIAGHIFAEKRRKLGVRTFSDLVVLKLNEKLLNTFQFQLSK